jgi:hypothetical protein
LIGKLVRLFLLLLVLAVGLAAERPIGASRSSMSPGRRLTPPSSSSAVWRARHRRQADRRRRDQDPVFAAGAHLWRGAPLQAGEYQFAARQHALVMEQMIDGVTVGWLTIPEG